MYTFLLWGYVAAGGGDMKETEIHSVVHLVVPALQPHSTLFQQLICTITFFKNNLFCLCVFGLSVTIMSVSKFSPSSNHLNNKVLPQDWRKTQNSSICASVDLER